MGLISIQQNDFQQALNFLVKSLLVAPNQPQALSHCGIALANLNRMDEAVICFDKAIALQADFVLAYNNRGTALQFLHRFKEAVASCGGLGGSPVGIRSGLFEIIGQRQYNA